MPVTVRIRLALAVFGAIVVGLALAHEGDGRPLPGAAQCPIFPRSSQWNQRVDGLPIGIPFVVVGGSQRKVPVSFEYAAGLPILPGLARYDEVSRGRIDHALRITVPRTRRAFVYPARHFASALTDPNLPAMGQRVRLRSSFDVSRFPRQARVVLRALKRYGALVADNGSAWYVSGAPSRGWDNDDLHSLHRVRGSDFEVVDTAGMPRPRR